MANVFLPIVLLDGVVVPGVVFASERSGEVEYVCVDEFSKKVVVREDGSPVTCLKTGKVEIVFRES